VTRREIWLGGLLSLMAGELAAQAFGPGEQALHIGAAEFIPASSDDTYTIPADGYLYGRPAVAQFIAPVRLPAGAEITGLCFYAFDSSPDSFVSMTLDVVALTPGGQSHTMGSLLGPLLATFDIGYGVVCSPPFSYVYRDTADVDGDGAAEHLVYRLVVDSVYREGAPQPGLGGARIFWRRQVSAAPATATFADVPTTHPFFRTIEALSASGITAGCGPGHFCPNQNVTRGEMAALLARALGLQWPY
jgi:hypothetical protein